MLMKDLFILSLFIIFYAYFGYPLSLFLLGLVYSKKHKKENIFPEITLIVVVHNEEIAIRKKLENILQLQYPAEKFQVIIASDGSSDETNNIIREYGSRGIELLAIPERRGKNEAQNKAIENSKGEILIFTDVDTIISLDSLKEIVSNFADPQIGCVSSVDRITGRDNQEFGESYYISYEMGLRQLESKVGSIVGASGSFFAARREICVEFRIDPPTVSDDFKAVRNSIKIGLRAISDPLSIGRYPDVMDKSTEYSRKIRTVIRGLTEFFHHLELLNIFRYGLFSYQYFCHKFLRWIVPFFLCSLLISNILISTHSHLYQSLLICQAGFYCMGFLRLKDRGRHTNAVFSKIAGYFILSNVAISLAWIRFLSGDRISKWEPSKR